MECARERFEERFPEFRNKALRYFRDWGYGPEARQDAFSRVLCLCWSNFVPLIKRGKADEQTLASTFWFSCRAIRGGRQECRTVKHSKFRELWTHMERDMRGLDLDSFTHPRDSVPDIVSFRLDTPAWLDSLSDVDHKRVMALATGDKSKDIARRLGTSEASVSAWRRKYHDSYVAFMACE
jgi:hypothetical protein